MSEIRFGVSENLLLNNLKNLGYFIRRRNSTFNPNFIFRCLDSLSSHINNFKLLALFNSNGHANGFESFLLAGNELREHESISQSTQFVFYNYDYTNELENLQPMGCFSV